MRENIFIYCTLQSPIVKDSEADELAYTAMLFASLQDGMRIFRLPWIQCQAEQNVLVRKRELANSVISEDQSAL